MNENAQAWVAALRSGEYKQGSNRLHYREEDGVERFCCLGVACALAAKAGIIEPVVNPLEDEDGFVTSEYEVRYGDQGEFLPLAVCAWLGLDVDATLGEFVNESGDPTTLASLNDRGEPFTNIADLIESEPKGLFAS